MKKYLIPIHNGGEEQGDTWIKKKGPIVSFCCCGYSLRSGCLIIGWLYLIYATLVICSLIYCLSFHRDVPYLQTIPYDDPTKVHIYAAVAVVDLAFTCFFDVLLLIGVYKEKPKYLQAFVIFCNIYVGLAVWKIIVKIVLLSATLQDYIVMPIGIGYLLYFAVVVESYKRVLLKNQEDAAYNALHKESPPRNEA